jgi:hypothetical protein
LKLSASLASGLTFIRPSPYPLMKATFADTTQTKYC